MSGDITHWLCRACPAEVDGERGEERSGAWGCRALAQERTGNGSHAYSKAGITSSAKSFTANSARVYSKAGITSSAKSRIDRKT
jgi:hypothetical protein